MCSTRLCLYLLLAISLFKTQGNAFNLGGFFGGGGGGGGGGDDNENSCDWEECEKKYLADTTAKNITQLYHCLSIEQARACLQDSNCPSFDFNVIQMKNYLDDDFDKHNCSQFTSPTSSTTSTTPHVPTPTTQPPSTCTPKLPQNASVIDLGKAVTWPTLSLVNRLCSQHSYKAVRHCSLFTYSHLRPFGQKNIQTCTLPGSWLLLRHSDVTIEVTGGIENNAVSSYTKIEKINITLHSPQCTSRAIFNYVATADKDLPTALRSSDHRVIPLYQPLEFHINPTKTMASILAPWLNLTVIIRRHHNYLSIVMQMPADLLDSSEGLCHTGCPNHTQNNINKLKQSSCNYDVSLSLNGCVAAGLLNVIPSESQLSLLLTHICQFDVLKNLTYSVLSILKAVASDYILLRDFGKHIIPEPFQPPVPQFSLPSTTNIRSTSVSVEVKPTTTQFATSLDGGGRESSQSAITSSKSMLVTKHTPRASNLDLFYSSAPPNQLRHTTLLVFSMLWFVYLCTKLLL